MVFTLMRVTVGAGAVTAHPDLHGLPGSNVLQQLVNGAEAWALAIALLGAFVGAGLPHPQPPLRGPRANGGADLGRGRADRRRRSGAGQFLPAPRDDGQVIGRLAKPLALFTVVAAIGCCAAPQPAAAINPVKP